MSDVVRPIFQVVSDLEAAMSFHRDRHAVLAGNIANVDTPGYQPIDLIRSKDLMADDGNPQKPASATVIVDAGTFNSADGNGVSLERELAKLDANRIRYQTTAELASRSLALLRYAAGDGQGS